MHAAALEQRRRIAIRRGQAGAVEAEAYQDVMDRLRPNVNANWDRVVRQFRLLRCQVRARYMASNEYAERPLLVLEIRPLQQMPTTRPPGNKTPWHVSIAFYDPDRRKAFMTATRAYTDWREVTLVGEIAGSTFQLDPRRCPVATDRRLAALHRADPWYGDRPLHISL